MAADLPAYKALRDAMLAAHPQAFTSDAAAEAARSAESYLPRLGLDGAEGGHFTLGAWEQGDLIGALGCERDLRIKVRHIVHLVGMMVRADLQHSGIGARLLHACIEALRATGGIEIVTLTVTHGNDAAIHLYEKCGFVRYGSLARAIRVDGRYHAKDQMALTL